jgi:biotin carboxyl carrier protein
MTARLRVGPSRATAQPGDPVRDLDLGDPAAPRIEPLEAGVVAVSAPGAGEGGAGTRVLVGPPRPAAGGSRLVEVVVDGWRFDLVVEDAGRAELRRRATRARDVGPASGPLEIRAIIPGRVAAVRVTTGDAVEAGQALLVVEAMKMQNELRAPHAGVVEQVAVGEGATIEHGDLLVVLR